MKAHPEMTVEKLLDLIAHDLPADALPESDGAPVPHAQRVEAREALMKAVRSGMVAFHCVGCGGQAPATSAKACVCGGFVCADCQAVEDEGVCNHDTTGLADD